MCRLHVYSWGSRHRSGRGAGFGRCDDGLTVLRLLVDDSTALVERPSLPLHF